MKNTDVIHLDQGEPAFLQEIFECLLGIIEPIIDFHYPDAYGDPELLHELNKIYPQFKYIVVTNGCTQALCGAMECFSHKCKQIYFPKPHWSRIPAIAARSGLICTDRQTDTNVLITSPNNPDGKIFSVNFEETVDIWDASYFNPFHPVYGEVATVNSKCSVFSSSKLLGTSGYRVGWLGTNDYNLAEYVSEYVDYTTIGVSVLSQKEIANILRHIRTGKYAKGFVIAEKILKSNHTLLEQKLGHYFDQLNSSGLFGWFKVKDPEKFDDALFTGLVSLMPGKAFGVEEEGFYRINLGAHQDNLVDGLNRLASVLIK